MRIWRGDPTEEILCVNGAVQLATGSRSSGPASRYLPGPSPVVLQELGLELCSVAAGSCGVSQDRSDARIAVLERMCRARPGDPRLRFGLAVEYENAGRIEDAVRELQTYLALTEDEGNAWGRLGALLRRLGRHEEARAAYRRGIEQARRHDHPSMAADLEGELADS